MNSVTPALFSRYPTPSDLAHAEPAELEEIIRSTGFYRAKARSLIGMGQALMDRFDSQVPTRIDDLVTLPGVGRKTANVIRSVAFDLPGLPVDTHVGRLSRRDVPSLRGAPWRCHDRRLGGAGVTSAGTRAIGLRPRQLSRARACRAMRRACSASSGMGLATTAA